MKKGEQKPIQLLSSSPLVLPTQPVQAVLPKPRPTKSTDSTMNMDWSKRIPDRNLPKALLPDSTTQLTISFPQFKNTPKTASQALSVPNIPEPVQEAAQPGPRSNKAAPQSVFASPKLESPKLVVRQPSESALQPVPDQLKPPKAIPESPVQQSSQSVPQTAQAAEISKPVRQPV